MFHKNVEKFFALMQIAMFTLLGGYEQKKERAMKRIIHQMLKNYNFRKFFH